MKCPQCKEGTLTVTAHRITKRGYTPLSEKAVMSCNNCGHKERFGV